MPIDMSRKLLLVALTLTAAACTVAPTVPAGEPCVAEGFTVVDGYSGSRRGACSVLGDNRVRVTILPEDDGEINDSPWFGFRLEPTKPTTAIVTLRYRGGHHRYRPKISYDGLHWQTVDEEFVATSRNGRKATLTVELADRSVWVSAQELVLPDTYDAWNRKIDSLPGIDMSLLGHSKDHNRIYYFDVNPDAPDILFIVGRQHPPEVSGSFAFFAFAETLFGDSALAQRFRERFRVIAVPLLNPDGVLAGNWRHNLNGVDLNRDWGPFTQPETQLVRDLLQKLDDNGHRIRMFADFHSTKRNVFYTQDQDHVTEPPGFTRAWLGSSAARLENYDFTNDEHPVSDQANSKNFMYKRYGIPAVTYEVGDETDRHSTQAAARVFAEELMTLLLQHAD
jgi:hypothetical protein